MRWEILLFPPQMPCQTGYMWDIEVTDIAGNRGNQSNFPLNRYKAIGSLSCQRTDTSIDPENPSTSTDMPVFIGNGNRAREFLLKSHRRSPSECRTYVVVGEDGSWTFLSNPNYLMAHLLEKAVDAAGNENYTLRKLSRWTPIRLVTLDGLTEDTNSGNDMIG